MKKQCKDFLNIFIPHYQGEYFKKGQKCRRKVLPGEWDYDSAYDETITQEGVAFSIVQDGQTVDSGQINA